MSASSRKAKTPFEGPFKELFIEYLRVKELRGCKVECQRPGLVSLNRFLVETRGHTEVTITEGDLDAWVLQSESRKGRENRFSIIDQFSDFAASKGYGDICRGESRFYRGAPDFQARILDDDELSAFFAAADAVEHVQQFIVYDHAMLFPLLVRLLYGCGLRISEGTGLRVNDIDFDTGALRILESKNGDSRLVYASDTLMAAIERYMGAITAHEGDGFLLRGVDGRAYRPHGAEMIMKRVRAAAGLEGEGQQPLRLHDLRHNFAVRAMEKMVDDGFDLYATIPYLCRYMGHSDVRSTEYYIRLAPRGFSRIMDRMDAFAPEVIPDLEGDL